MEPEWVPSLTVTAERGNGHSIFAVSDKRGSASAAYREALSVPDLGRIRTRCSVDVLMRPAE